MIICPEFYSKTEIVLLIYRSTYDFESPSEIYPQMEHFVSVLWMASLTDLKSTNFLEPLAILHDLLLSIYVISGLLRLRRGKLKSAAKEGRVAIAIAIACPLLSHALCFSPSLPPDHHSRLIPTAKLRVSWLIVSAPRLDYCSASDAPLGFHRSETANGNHNSASFRRKLNRTYGFRF